jgi:hypothetical protein
MESYRFEFQEALTAMVDNSWSLTRNIYSNEDIPFRLIHRRIVLMVLSKWVLVIMIGALLGIKIAQMIDARGKTITHRVDILKDRLNAHELSGPPGNKGWRYPASALFGNTLWERKFPCVFHSSSI